MQTSDFNVNNTESDHANAIFSQFQDAIFSREHTPIKILTKIIFDLLQWKKNCNAITAKRSYYRFFHLTFCGHFGLEANDISRNRSRVIFGRACVGHFSPVKGILVPRATRLNPSFPYHVTKKRRALGTRMLPVRLAEG